MGNVINDYELIYMIHQNDEYALQELLDKYSIIIRKYLTARFNRKNIGNDLEDCILECIDRLYELVMNFREDRNCSFSTFNMLCLERKLFSYLRKSYRLMEMGYNEISLDMFVGETEETYLAELITDNDKLKEPSYYYYYKEAILHLNQYLEGLDNYDRSVWYNMVNDVSYEEASRHLNIKQKKYDNSVQKIKKGIYRAIKDN